LFAASAVVVVALVPALVSGVAVWIPAVAAAVILIVVFVMRRRRAVRFSLIPWQLVLLAAGLFLVIEAAHFLGLGAALAMISGHGEDLLSVLRLAGVGAAGANLADNLPAFLAIAPAADTPARVVALLIGVNVGPLITPWASIATLLWHQRLVAMDVRISWTRYALLGLVVAPVTVVAATLVLVLVE
jgi:Na+/H+ antiporter NhaD/arsenite permease-like protein